MYYLRLSLLALILFSSALGQNHILALDGENDYVDFPSAVITTTSFTIEGWIYLIGPGGGIDQQSPFFEQRTNDVGCNQSAISYFIESHSWERVVRFALRSDSECAGVVQHPSPEYGDWHHYAVVQDGNYSNLYMDGILIAGLFYAHEGNYDTNIQHVSLGQAIHEGNSYGSTHGYMEEVRIWDHARTESEIVGNMYDSLTGDEEGLTALWNFEGGSLEVLDQTDNGHTGTFMHGAHIVESDFLVPTYPWGDLNEDENVNIQDVILLIEHIMGFDN